MIRFKVIKASRIMFVFTMILLAAVLVLILLTSKGQSTKSFPAASLVKNNTAKIQGVFAVSDEAEGRFNKSDYDNVQEDIDIKLLSCEDDSAKTHSRPRIIIYHTHTHEAYEQNTSEPYEAVEAWRTKDSDYSVVRIGKELARSLQNCGFYVVHDMTDHELDDLSTAYDRSLKTLESYSEQFDLYIDLHRDAYSEGLAMKHRMDDGSEAAQLMFLVGNGDGFDVKPYYFENHLFAKKLMQRINEVHPGICRDVLIKDGRYNQHIGVFSLLVEVGHNRNSLSEALNAVQPLADGICDIFIERPDAMIEGILEAHRHSY